MTFTYIYSIIKRLRNDMHNYNRYLMNIDSRCNKNFLKTGMKMFFTSKTGVKFLQRGKIL